MRQVGQLPRIIKLINFQEAWLTAALLKPLLEEQRNWNKLWFLFPLRAAVSKADLFSRNPLFLGAFAERQKATVRFIMSVRLSAWDSSAPTGSIFIKFDIWVFFENMSRKFKFHYNLTRVRCTFHGDLWTFMITSRSVLRKMRNVSDKRTENENTHFYV